MRGYNDIKYLIWDILLRIVLFSSSPLTDDVSSIYTLLNIECKTILTNGSELTLLTSHTFQLVAFETSSVCKTVYWSLRHFDRSLGVPNVTRVVYVSQWIVHYVRIKNLINIKYLISNELTIPLLHHLSSNRSFALLLSWRFRVFLQLNCARLRTRL